MRKRNIHAMTVAAEPHLQNYYEGEDSISTLLKSTAGAVVVHVPVTGRWDARTTACPGGCGSILTSEPADNRTWNRTRLSSYQIGSSNAHDRSNTRFRFGKSQGLLQHKKGRRRTSFISRIRSRRKSFGHSLFYTPRNRILIGLSSNRDAFSQRGSGICRNIDGEKEFKHSSSHMSCSGSFPTGSSDAKSSQSLSSPSSSSKACPQNSRRSSQNFKRRKKKHDDISDIEDEDAKDCSQVESGPRREYACPFFKAYPSKHLSCRDSGWVERRKVKDHLKRYHYGGKLPADIKHSHLWEDWYQFIIKDTDRENRSTPNSDPNFIEILSYLIKAGEQLGGSDAPCFGTCMVKLFQHAQRHPTETERLIQGMVTILDRPCPTVSAEDATIATDLSTLPHVENDFTNYNNGAQVTPGSQDVFTPLAWPTNTAVSSYLELSSPFITNSAINQTESNQYLVLTAAPAGNKPSNDNEVWNLTPMMAHSENTGDISEFVHSDDYINEAMENVTNPGPAGCHDVPPREFDNFSTRPDLQAAFPFQDMRVPIKPSGDFLGQKPMQMDDNTNNIIHAAPKTLPRHSRIPLTVVPPSQMIPQITETPIESGLPTPGLDFAFPQRRTKSSTVLTKRKRPPAAVERMGNIMIPSYNYDSRFNSMPTPSPSVYSRAGSSLQTPSLLTPYTGSTTSSFSSSSPHEILVISGRRPEMYRFGGPVSSSIDQFVVWLTERFGFEFTNPNRGIWFMNDGNLRLWGKREVHEQLMGFWGETGDTFFNRAIPWFWIDMPCSCFAVNSHNQNNNAAYCTNVANVDYSITIGDDTLPTL
ncbi:hypothetical protein ABW19_dt0205837 [Dactylella cylindrospora]|nr:hypothetical protein ABW19_dt0205837 [Dactylella cylindrospora]